MCIRDRNRTELEKIRGTEISIIFQEPMSSLNPSMKCGRQVFEVLQTHNISNNKENVVRVLDLFKKVKLKNPKSVYNKYPHELSGGQQQRIMIAIAIACNPKILIADEPTTSLDGIVKEKIISLLRKIQKETKMSIIFVSHDLNLVSKFANNIIKATRVILPISNQKDIPSHFGLRHRAAIGITEKTDALAIVVSEESGQISYINNSNFIMYNNTQELIEKLDSMGLGFGMEIERIMAVEG